jgi:hypothetical protein
MGITAMQMKARRQGADALRGSILMAAKGESYVEPVFLPLGAALHTSAPPIELLVRRSLRHASLEHKISATFAAVFFLPLSEEMSCLLTEREVVEKEDRLVVQASREVLNLWAETKDGGRCLRCGQAGTDPETQRLLGWTIRRGG